MAKVVVIPFTRLSRSARQEVIDEFITRDSSVWDGTLEEKRERVLEALHSKEAVITFNTKDKTTDIRPIDQLKELHLFDD